MAKSTVNYREQDGCHNCDWLENPYTLFPRCKKRHTNVEAYGICNRWKLREMFHEPITCTPTFYNQWIAADGSTVSIITGEIKDGS